MTCPAVRWVDVSLSLTFHRPCFSSCARSVALDADNAALVISGPNAGGKTVVLKTAGLFALMAKHAIPLPTRPGARVDFMQVMADIGDMQVGPCRVRGRTPVGHKPLADVPDT